MPGPTPAAWVEDIGDSERHNWPVLLIWSQVSDLCEELSELERTCDVLAEGALVGAFASSFVSQATTLLSLAAQDEYERVSGRSIPDDGREMWDEFAESGHRWAELMDLGDLVPRAERLGTVFRRAARLFVDDLRAELASGTWAAASLASVSHLKVLGDVHPRGAVLGIYAEGRPVLVYKPRSLAPDVLIDEILGILELPDPPRTPRTLDRGTHGWQEYIVFENVETDRERAVYYRRFGALIAVASALGMQDLHYENVKCARGAPYVIDAECAFGSGLSSSSPADDGYFARNAPSLLATLLVPNWGKRFEDADPYDASALGAFADPARQAQVRRITRRDGVLRTSYERLLEPQVFGSQPHIGSTRAPFADHVADLEEGFGDASARLSDPDVQERIITAVARRDDLRCRILTRSTASFVSLLQVKAPHGERTAGASPSSAEVAWILQEEARQLDDGCVPVFEVDVGRGRLESGTGNALETGRDVLGLWTERFLALTDRGAVPGQTHLLRRSLELGLEDPDWTVDSTPRTVPQDVRRMPSPVPAIEQIVDRLRATAQRTGDHVWWVSSIQHSPSRHEIFVTRNGVYDGLAGIVLAAGAAALESHRADDLYRLTSASLLRALERFVESRARSTDEVLSLGLGEGPLGAALALGEAARLRDDAETLDRLGVVCVALDGLSPSMASPDHLNGAAGVMLAAERLGAIRGAAPLSRLGSAARDRLVEIVATTLRKGRAEPGLAHGLSGIVLALAAEGDDPDVRAFVSECFDLEQTLLAKAEAAGDREQAQKALSGSWCWGATGQIESRLHVGHESGIDELRERMVGSPLTGMSLCHGSLGRAIVQQSAPYIDRWGRRDADRTRREALEMLIRDPLGEVAEPPYASRVGLFTGLSGKLLYLAAHRDRASVRLASLSYELG